MRIHVAVKHYFESDEVYNQNFRFTKSAVHGYHNIYHWHMSLQLKSQQRKIEQWQ
jgi:hypothetical protein